MGWRLRQEEPGKAAVIEVEGVVDSTNVESFFTFINSVLKKDVPGLVLDLSRTSYISSGGVSVIVDACRKLEERGGKMALAGASEMVRDVFEVVGIDKLLPCFDSVEEALRET